jgi:hypothetical protein
MTRFGRTIRRELPKPRSPIRRPVIVELITQETGTVLLRLREKGRRLAIEYDVEQLCLRGIVNKVRKEKNA